MTPDPISYTYTARIERVVDGDTIVASVDLGFHTSRREHFRLAGINCPEMNTQAGRTAKDFVVLWVAGQSAFVFQSRGQDKYGRWLAHIWGTDRTKTLNQVLLDSFLAVPYV